MDYCYILEISFLRAHAYSVLLKTLPQIQHNVHFLLFLVQISSVFKVTKLKCCVGLIK